MKLSVAALFLGSASAFAPASVERTSSALNVDFNKPSEALPFGGARAPDTLDGSLVGDVGFDPVGFSTAPFSKWFDVGQKTSMSDLEWLREAEITHGRIAQLAVLGFIWPSVFGTFPGNDWAGGVDVYSYVNPTEALDHVPVFAIEQIGAFMIWTELNRVRFIREDGAERLPGDLRLGQGEGRWNPFALDYSPEAYEEKQLQEIKHCRLAMLGSVGLWLQAVYSGTDIGSQLGAALVSPDYVAKAGYFLPEGI
jgi:light-harvesting complex I chlorophyll a/b binding protein 1